VRKRSVDLAFIPLILPSCALRISFCTFLTFCFATGFTSNHRLTLFIDGVSAMTAPVHSVGEGATYARMTVSLNGWGVEMVGGTLYLECGLLFEGEEGSVDTARHAHSFCAILLTTLIALCVFQLPPVDLCQCWPLPIFQSCRYEATRAVLQFCTQHSRIMKLRNVDEGLWFRDIHGGPHAFGLEPSSSRWEDDESS
jgi:hypothetical protein